MMKSSGHVPLIITAVSLRIIPDSLSSGISCTSVFYHNIRLSDPKEKNAFGEERHKSGIEPASQNTEKALYSGYNDRRLYREESVPCPTN